MTATRTQRPARYGRLMAGLAALVLSACSQNYIHEPWAGRDAQWKQAHFASPTPDEQLRIEDQAPPS